MDQSDVIATAFEKAGGIKAVATAMRMTEEGVRLWRVRGKVPAERVIELEELSGIARERLRPDLYAPATDRPQAA